MRAHMHMGITPYMSICISACMQYVMCYINTYISCHQTWYLDTHMACHLSTHTHTHLWDPYGRMDMYIMCNTWYPHTLLYGPIYHITHVAQKVWEVYHVHIHGMWWHGVWIWYSNTMYTMIPNIMTYHDIVLTWYGIHDTDISIMQPAASMPIIHLGME